VTTFIWNVGWHWAPSFENKAHAKLALEAMKKLASNRTATRAWFKTTTTDSPFSPSPTNYPYAMRDEVTWEGVRRYGWGVLDNQRLTAALRAAAPSVMQVSVIDAGARGYRYSRWYSV
jgi:hypothetical protein